MRTLSRETKRFFREYKLESVLILITVFILTTCTAYSDFYATSRHGIEFWTVLFEGHPLQFYEHCYDIAWGNDVYNGNAGCAYDFSVYAVFAVWNLPIWIIEKICGINAQSNLFCVIWGKMLLVAAVFLSAKLLCEVYKLITENKDNDRQNDFLILNYLSSLLLLSYTVSSGNYDILAEVFILCGIINYLKGNYRKFLLWFIIAITFKYFAAFIFIPLVLLKEKRFLFITRDMLILISLSVVEKLIFTQRPITNLSESAGGYFLGLIPSVTMAQKIDIEGIGTVSILFILYAALAIYCYMQDVNSDAHIFKKKVIYACLCSWAIFFLFCSINSYWIVLIVPFLILTLQSGNGNKKISYMMESMFSISMFLILNLRQSWILGGRSCMGMLLYRVLSFFFPQLPATGGYPLGWALSYVNNIFDIQVYLSSICLISLIVFLVINFPGRNEKKNNFSDKQIAVFSRNRLLINIGFSLVPITIWVLNMFGWLALY